VSGLFVTFEGIDRSGKTTQARMLVEALEGAVAVREPGGTELGEELRALVKGSIPMGGRAEALLFAAARAQLVDEVIRPALERGQVVVSDRYLDSSLAYQGAARNLGVEEVAQVNEFATERLVPDITFFLELDPAIAEERAGHLDRFEDEGDELQREVASAYVRLAEAEPRRWKRIDASRSTQEVHADVLAIVNAARAGAPA
jgi:dTMP kinase